MSFGLLRAHFTNSCGKSAPVHFKAFQKYFQLSDVNPSGLSMESGLEAQWIQGGWAVSPMTAGFGHKKIVHTEIFKVKSCCGSPLITGPKEL